MMRRRRLHRTVFLAAGFYNVGWGIFAAFDPPVATFRHKELATYKGTRKAMPDDLAPQRAPAREVARAWAAERLRG